MIDLIRLSMLPFFLLVSSVSFAEPPRYAAKVITPREGSQSFDALHANSFGDFCGVELRDDDKHYVLWLHDSGYFEIPAPDGRVIDGCSSLNDQGAVVGQDNFGTGFYWSPEKGWYEIPRPPGCCYTGVVPMEINESGVVVGFVEFNDGKHWRPRAFVWTVEGGMRFRDGPEGTAAVSVNNDGVIAYYAAHDATYHTFLYNHGKVRHVAGRPGFSAQAVGVNGNKQTAMQLSEGGLLNTGSALWDPQLGLQDIPHILMPLGLSEAGVVLGWGITDNSWVSKLWRADYGTVDLTSTIERMNLPATSLFTHDISRSGIVTGGGYVDGVLSAVIYFPLSQRELQ